MRYLLLLLPMLAFASGDDIEIENDLVTGDVATNIKGSTVYGMSGGDMDINQCLATHSILFGLWQGTHLNTMCVADGLDADGKHHEAAMMRCSVRRFRKVYGSVEECIDTTEYRPPPPAPAPVMKEGSGGYDLEEYRVEHEKVDDSIEDRLARIEAGNRAAARKAQQRRDYARQTIQRLENDPED